MDAKNYKKFSLVQNKRPGKTAKFRYHEIARNEEFQDRVITADLKPPHSLLRRWALMAGGALLLVVIIICVSVWLHRESVRNNNAILAAHQDTQEFSGLQIDAKAESARGQYIQAATNWVAYAKRTPDKKHRAEAWQNAGLLYMSAGSFSKAENCFNQSIAVGGLTYIKSTEIAAAAVRSGDKTTAIHYLREALKLIPGNTPAIAEQKQLFNQEIKQIEQLNQ